MAFKYKPSLFPRADLREYQTCGELRYWSARLEQLFVVPELFLSDGASIPDFLHSLVGTPFDPRWIYEAILHDFLCRNGVLPRKQCDEVFFDALSENPHVSASTAEMFYTGVRIGSVWMEDRYYTRHHIGKSMKASLREGAVPNTA